MSYLGLQPNTPLLNTSTQTFSGNAVATQFTLARSVASASDLDVMIGSTMQRPFTDYIAGNISLQFTSPPASGSNNITVTYRAGALNSLDLTVNTFNAGTVADPGVVSLAANNTGIYWANASSMSVTVSGTNRATFNASAASTNNTSGALVINGGIGASGNINTSGKINITDTTQSANVNSGSITTAGGVGVVGNLNVGGDITCVGDFTVNGTFTTTGTDSLQVTDPFIFLANNNPGDTYDTGVIAQYFDGGNTRYTGYFRDITDAKYKLFTNLLTQPTTTVDTTDPSFQYTDLILANLSATGTVTGTYFVGNGSQLTGIATNATTIYNDNSAVIIPASNGNIVNNVNGVTIANVWSGGLAVTGALSASTTISAAGNIIGGNIQTAGIFSATGNIISAANISTGNLLTGGAISSTGNVIGGNVIGTTAVSTGGNVNGGNLKTAGIVSASGDVYGNNFIASANVTATLNISATANVIGGNILASGVISTAGNITGGNIIGTLIASSVSVSGNVTGGNLNAGTGSISTTGNVNSGNVIATALVQSATLSATGNVTFSGTTQNINVGTSQTTGNVTVGGTSQTGTITIGQATTSQTVNIGNGVTGTGNTKTIQIGENGADGSTTNIDIGPVSATTAAGLVTFNTATTVAIANTGTSALSVAGNIAGGNINSGGSSTVTGNIVGGNISTAGLATVTGNITGGNIITAGVMSAASISVSATVLAAGNVTGGNILTGGAISGTGNITGGNIDTGGLITAAGNIVSTSNVRGGNLLTTSLLQGNIVSATSNVIATGNVTAGNLNAAGLSLSSNVVSALATTANITGANIIATAAMSAASVSASGNITGGNLNAAGLSLSSNVVSALNSTSAVTTTANITGGNILTSGLISATSTITSAADITGGNILTSGFISATGNITGGNVLGGANVNATTHTGATVSVTGNVTGGNIISSVLTSAANITVTSNAANAWVILTPTGTGTIIANKDIINGQANGVGNIGSSTNYFNTVFAKATSAQYADLAEWYEADADYEPGTVLVFGGSKEVTEAIGINDVRVAGVVSTNPAHIMNAGLEAEYTAALALTGRVPTKVVGPVAKGDMMVTAGGGRAQACTEPRMGSVIGKALQDHPGGQGTIEIVVGRM
jgi:hypothetical protein